MGERRVSGSRLARTFTLVRWSQMGSLLHYFWAPPAQLLRLVLDPTDRYLESLRASSPMLIRTTACLSPRFLILLILPLLPSRFDAYSFCPAPLRLFSLFPRPPSPPSCRKEKSRPRSYLLGPNPTGTRGRLTERKTVLETKRGT
jgi:hypothetical protein